MRRTLLMFLLPMLAQPALVSPARAQSADRAPLPWRTLETAHFRYIFPRELEGWALPVSARFEAVRAAVDALVGYAPSQRVTVVMDDPSTISNGLTWPELYWPTILFLATPPGPRSEIGDYRTWGEMLSVHEYAHAAHLTRPSRNPLRRELERVPLLPLDLGPIALKAPRWALEGYATYVEGKLTGSGRPHGVWRPAVLRQWALEGKLPSYGGMSGTEGYRGGSFAYLAGSAYLQWLLARMGPAGDSALPHVWRRLTARKQRGFARAFAGVFAGTPPDLYDRFRVDATTRAVEVRRLLEAAGLAEGDTVQSLEWETGAPAVSRDGKYMAIVLRRESFPSRVVVWSTAPEPPDTAAARRQAEELKKDPEDVPAVRWRPRPKKALATLWPAAGGRAYDRPRFLPDGEHILLTRFEPQPDGSRLPELVVWEWKHGGVRRITHGGAIVSADPTPDGLGAIGERCRWGTCGLVYVRLANGAMRTIVPGVPDRVQYARPRVSPDGRSIAVAVHRYGLWRPVLLDVDGGGERALGPEDGAQRYDPAFLPDGSGVVVTSEAGGIPNLEVLGLAYGAARPITRVTGAAMAPEPAPDGSVYFLRLHATGLDLARVRADAQIGPVVVIDPAFAPAAQIPPAPGYVFPVLALPPPVAYGLGPRRYRFLPSLSISGGRLAGRLAVESADPVGRFDWLAQGAFGGTNWEGASLRLVYRRFQVQPWAGLFATSYHPREFDAFQEPTGLPESVGYYGASGALELRYRSGAGMWRLRGGASVGAFGEDSVAGTGGSRTLGFVNLTAARAFALGPSSAGVAFLGNGAVGETGGVGWGRVLAALSLGAHAAGSGFGGEVSALAGALSGAGDTGSPGLERFTVGGEEPPLFDPAIMAQQIAMPALPPGSLVGRQMVLGRIGIGLAGASAYFWAARAGEPVSGWQRVVGIEQALDTDPMPLLRVPGAHIVAGLGYTLDERPHRTLRLYGMATLRP